MESLEKTRERAELGMGTLREALELLSSGRLYQQTGDLPPDAGAYDGNMPKDVKYVAEEPIGYLRPGADYVLDNYGNTSIYSKKYAEEGSTPVFVTTDYERITRLELEVSRLRRENEKLTKWKENIVQLCVDLGAKVQDWTGGDTSKGFAHYFISSLYTRAVKAEALAIPPGWLNYFFRAQQEERKKQEREPLRAY